MDHVTFLWDWRWIRRFYPSAYLCRHPSAAANSFNMSTDSSNNCWMFRLIFIRQFAVDRRMRRRAEWESGGWYQITFCGRGGRHWYWCCRQQLAASFEWWYEAVKRISSNSSRLQRWEVDNNRHPPNKLQPAGYHMQHMSNEEDENVIHKPSHATDITIRGRSAGFTLCRTLDGFPTTFGWHGRFKLACYFSEMEGWIPVINPISIN